MRDVRIVLAGVGGYGRTYLQAILGEGAAHAARIVAGVDPHPPAASAGALKNAGVPVFSSLADVPAETADLAIVAAPIHLHAPLSCLALEKGWAVLCEKPLAGCVEDGVRVVKTSRSAGRFAAIGYQWSYTDAIQALKRDIVSGLFGRPLRMRTICVWPRRKSYYERSAWAGKLVMPDGSKVHDSPANNACAHYLHNMLFLAGGEMTESALPVEVTAELYRCKEIESYDTVAIRAVTDNGAEILLYATHSGRPETGPVFDLVFEKATVTYHAERDPVLRLHGHDGTIRDYGDPDATRSNRLWHTVEAVRTGTVPACPATAALSQTLCVSAALESSAIHPLPEAEVITKGDDLGDSLTWMPSLAQTLWDCYEAWRLPAEIGAGWARPGRTVRVKKPEA